MKSTHLKSTAVLIGVLSLGVVEPAMALSHLQSGSRGPEYLFVVHATSANISDNGDGKDLVTLHKPSITAFTDRPYYKALPVRVGDYIALWGKSLRGDFSYIHPNAALAGELKGQELNAVLELNSMKWDASKADMTYTTKVLYNGAHLPSGKAKNVALFVDSSSISSSGF